MIHLIKRKLIEIPKLIIPIIGAREIGRWEVWHRDRNGKIIWHDILKNTLANEGQYAMLDVFLRAGTAPSAFYLRLFNDTPVKTDILGDITGEPSTHGYAAQEITRNGTGWPTLALDSGDEMATSLEVTFEATGGSWGPVTYMVLATSSDNSGKHVAFAALSMSRTLQEDEALGAIIKFKQT